MDDLPILTLCGFALLAGGIDAVAGGGGLIQLPALFVFLPQVAIPTLLGINKLSSIAGTSMAVQQYAGKVEIGWRPVLVAAIAALAGSFLGAAATGLVRPQILRPLILTVLILVAAYTFYKKDFGLIHAPKLSPLHQTYAGLSVGFLLGFYDGFLGPGTGSFLTFAFVGIFGFGFLIASASAKVVNVATNLSALLYFISTNNMIYAVAVPMALSNILGALIGSKLAMTKGAGFIRALFLVVVTALILKMAYDIFAS